MEDRGRTVTVQNEAWQEILGDPREFLRLLEVVTDKGKRFQFDDPFQEQVTILDALMNYNNVYIVKPRQVGSSTVVRAFFFWMLYTCPDPIRALLVTHEHRSSIHLHETLNHFYKSLLKVDPRLLRDVSATQDIFRFIDTGAESHRLMIGSQAQGKSFTFQMGHFTEVGSWHENKNADPYAAWTSLNATMHPGPYYKCVVESTGHGPGNLFHQLIKEAERSNVAKVLFFPWSLHHKYRLEPPPDFERTDEEEMLASLHGLGNEQLYWRRVQLAKSTDLRTFRHNYPLTLIEAFMSEAGTFFDVEVLNVMMANAQRVEPLVERNGFTLYKRPVMGHRYAIGVDSASGIGEDASVIQVLDADECEQVAVLHNNRVKPEVLAEQAAELGFAFNKAIILTEKKGEQGGITLFRLKQLGYPNLWVNEKGDAWDTNPATKRLAYTQLRMMIQGMLPKLYHPATINELTSIVEKGNGAIEAPTGSHDDLADGLAFALVAMKSAERLHTWSQARLATFRSMMKNLPDHYAKQRNSSLRMLKSRG